MIDETTLREIREGLTKLYVPDVPYGRGPGMKTGVPFFNPTMEKNRDMSVLLVRALKKPNITVLDGLSATGAFGIRIALEVPDTLVTCNERNPFAVELISRNSSINNIQLEGIKNEILQSHLYSNKYDLIDIDPFGTPVPYIDAAFQSVLRGGIISVTATDTAVLCGTHPKTCIRRYDSQPLHIDCCKEIALRILIGYCGKIAAKYDKSMSPILSFSTDHYFRIFISVNYGANKADESLSHLGYLAFEKETGNRFFVEKPQSDCKIAGPLWVGELMDYSIVSRLSPLQYMGHETSLLVEALKTEAGAPGLYVTSDFLSKQLKSSAPKLIKLLNSLHDNGYTAVRTHFDLRGIKTDAPWDELVSIYRKLHK